MTIAYVQTIIVQVSNATSATSAGMTVTGGNLVIVDPNWSLRNGGALSATPFTDSKSQTWTDTAAGKLSDPTNSETYEKYNANAAAGSTTWTLSGTSAGYGILRATEFSGHDAAPADVATGGQVTINNGASSGTASGALGISAGMVWSTVCNRINSAFETYSSVGGGFTSDANLTTSDSSGHVGMVSGYKIVASNASCQMTYSGSASEVGMSTISAWKAAAGGGGSTNTITLVVGSLGLSSVADSMASVMPVVVGSLTLTGQTVLRSVGQQMTAVVGNLTLSSQPAQMVAGYTANKADLTLAGGTVSFSVGKQVVLSVGALTLSGQTLSKTDSLAGVVGALALTGYAVTFSHSPSQGVTLVQGALALTGYPVSFTLQRWSPVVESAGAWTPVSESAGVWTPIPTAS